VISTMPGGHINALVVMAATESSSVNLIGERTGWNETPRLAQVTPRTRIRHSGRPACSIHELANAFDAPSFGKKRPSMTSRCRRHHNRCVCTLRIGIAHLQLGCDVHFLGIVRQRSTTSGRCRGGDQIAASRYSRFSRLFMIKGELVTRSQRQAVRVVDVHGAVKRQVLDASARFFARNIAR